MTIKLATSDTGIEHRIEDRSPGAGSDSFVAESATPFEAFSKLLNALY